MMRVENLGFGHGNRLVGTLPSLEVHPRQLTVILGPNGVGKTTLFRTMLGLQPALSGYVFIDRVDLVLSSRQEIARQVAYVPQGNSIVFSFRVLDVVLMARAPRLPAFAAPGRQDRAAAMAALEAVGIGHLAGRLYSEVSGGERQLALIARALAQETVYLVLDEPTASLDYGNQYRVLDLIADLARRGKGVILSTHQPDHALRLADQVVLMMPGGGIEIGAPGRVLTSERLKATYGLDVAIRNVPDIGRDVIIPLGYPGQPRQEKNNGAAE